MASGLVPQLTVTVNEHVAVLLAASVTLNTLVVTPKGKVAPLASPEICEVVGVQLSVPEGVPNVTTASQTPVPVPTLMFAGQVMAGNSVSLINTEKEQLLVFPEASTTLKVLTVLPTGNAEPLARPAVWLVVGVQLSVPVGTAKLTTFEHWPASLLPAKLAGQVMDGG